MKHYRKVAFAEHTKSAEPIYLGLSDAVLERIEDAIEPLRLASSEDFAILAILFALRSIEDGDRLTMLGLVEG